MQESLRLPTTQSALSTEPPQRRKRGRPRKVDLLVRQAQELASDRKAKRGRPPGGLVKLSVDEPTLAKWFKGQGLREHARTALGLAIRTVIEVLKSGRIVNGVRPEVALAHALGSQVTKVAGFDDKQGQPQTVTLVQVAIGQPGSGSGVSAQVVEAVRSSPALPAASDSLLVASEDSVDGQSQ